MSSQRQQGGDHSVNLQADVAIYHGGISYTEARAIAYDVFKANALEMAGIARSVAAERFEEWSDKFLNRLQQVSPALLGALQNPDIQYSLFSAQRDFARSGDELLGDSLVELLVARCQTDSHSLQKLVLNEAIATLPKLTSVQVNILTLIWTMTKTYEPKIASPSELAELWAKALAPLLSGLTSSRSNFDHLVYAGCINLSLAHRTFWELTMRAYGALFSEGLAKEDVPAPLAKYWDDERYFKPGIRNPALKRVAERSEMVQDGVEPLPDQENHNLNELRQNNYLKQADVAKEMKGFPMFAELCDLWDDTVMSGADLSTVGLAIAHSNASRLLGPEASEPLDLWLAS